MKNECLITFTASGPMVKAMMQWKALVAVGDTKLSSTILHCFNFHQGLKRGQKSKLKLISPKDIAGKTKIYL